MNMNDALEHMVSVGVLMKFSARFCRVLKTAMLTKAIDRCTAVGVYRLKMLDSLLDKWALCTCRRQSVSKDNPSVLSRLMISNPFRDDDETTLLIVIDITFCYEGLCTRHQQCSTETYKVRPPAKHFSSYT